MKRTAFMALLFAVALSVAAGGFPRTGESADYWYNTVGAADLENPLHFGQRTIVRISQRGQNYLLTFADEQYIEPDEPSGYTDNVIAASITEFYVYDPISRSYVDCLNLANKTALVPIGYSQNISGTSIFYLQCRAEFGVTFKRDSSDLGDINWDLAYFKLPAFF
ncbi:MAG: hypothetical protein LBU13_06285 [Synergistaceae bacterium]|nr:hypothetical protein [Synergistaceae bacterium]